LLEHDGKPYDFSWRRDIIHSEIFLPENAPPEFKDNQILWSAAEYVEDNSTRRKTARTAHELILAFPRELKFDTSIGMAREFIIKCLVSQGMCVDFNVHCGDSKDKDSVEADHKKIPPHNPHCHIQTTTRHVSRDGFGKLKAREWESYGNSALLVKWRKEWADIQNKMFQLKGIPARVSHERSIKRDTERESSERGR
jgi:hypothetical protein